MSFTNISREELERWPNVDPQAASRLPELVSRLIAETARGTVREVHAPQGLGVTSPGFDLSVRTSRETSWVPRGVSVWECSIEARPQRKAERDISKRSSGALGAPKSKVHYRAITPRPWVTSKFDARVGDGFQSVRGLGLDEMVTWLQQAPATTVWLRDLMGIPVDGLTHWETWWAAWLASATPALDAEIVLAGREDAATDLVETVEGPAIRTIGFDAFDRAEVRAFVAAAASRAPGSRLHSEAVFVDSRERLIGLGASGLPAVAVISDPSWLESLPTQHRLCIVVCIPALNRRLDTVPLVSSSLAGKALESRGIEFYRAHDLGVLARRSVTALRRRLALQPELFTPSWAIGVMSREHRRALLIDQWEDTGGDAEVVASFLRVETNDVSDVWARFSQDEDHPLASIDYVHYVVSARDSLELVAHRLTKDDLTDFGNLCRTVLSSDSELRKASSTDRLYRQLQGEVERASFRLRSSLQRGLAALATCQAKSYDRYAEAIVEDVLFDGKVAIRPEQLHHRGLDMSVVAEAAPNSVLKYWEAVSLNEPHELFTDRSRDLFADGPPSPHLKAMTSLKTLAWNPAFLARVIQLLARLHEADPGGKWADRPLETIAGILTPRFADTYASWAQRLDAVETLARTSPTAAFKVLSALVDGEAFRVISPQPEYRDWGVQERDLTWADIRTRTSDLVAIGLRMASAMDIPDLVQWFGKVPAADRTLVVERVRTLAVDPTARIATWDACRSFVGKHRTYADADWSLPSEVLAPLVALRDEMEPPSAIDSCRWLFAGGRLDIDPEEQVEMPAEEPVEERSRWQAREKRLNELRLDAVRRILDEAGQDALLDFATTVSDSRAAGVAFAQCVDNDSDATIVVLLGATSDEHVERFCSGYLWTRMLSSPAALDSFLLNAEHAGPRVRAWLLHHAPFDEQLVRRLEAESQEVRAEYWSSFTIWGHGRDMPLVSTAVRELLAHGNIAGALGLLAHYRNALGSDFHLLALAAFEQGVAQGSSLASLSHHDLQELVNEIDEGVTEATRERVVRVEAAAAPALDDSRQYAIHREIVRDSATFAALALTPFTDKDHPNHAARADQSFRLLRGVKTLPGTRSDGSIDTVELGRWLREIGTAAEAAGEYRDYLWGKVGELFASVPSDGPHLLHSAAVNEIEAMAEPALEEGVQRGIFNSRGVSSRGLEDGGESELGLALEHERQAVALAGKPRVSLIFQELASQYRAYANQEDQRAEKRKRGLGL